MMENKEFNSSDNENNKGKLSKQQKGLIAALVAAILLLILLLGSYFGIRAGRRTEKNNICNLAKTYADRGEFERALNKLDNYLEKHGEDADVWDLWNIIIDMKKAAGGETPSTVVNNNYTTPGNIKVDVDTTEISNAMQDSISTMKDALAQTNKQAEDNRKAMENLIKMQEEQKKADEKRKAEEEKAAALKQKQDEQKAAEEAAKAEQKRIQEEKRKAEEEAIAKKNAELKKQLDAVNADIQRGKTALATGNIEEAMKAFENAQNGMPAEAGNTIIASKSSEIAQALFDAAEKTDTPEKKAELMKDAVAMAQLAIQGNPKDPEAHYILAQNALMEKDYNTALEEMKKAVEYDPNNYLYYYNLGKIQYTLRKYSEASSSFTTSCKLNDKFAPSRYNLGLTQIKLKNDTAALDAFRKTIDIDSRHEKAYLEEGKILAGRGDYTGAIAAYEEVLKINNINVQAANLLAGVYYQKKNYDKAEECYKRALTMIDKTKNPDEMIMAKYNLSTVLFDAGKLSDSEKYAREAYEGLDSVKANSAKAEIIYNYGLILDNTGKDNDAIEIYMEALKKNPDHQKTKLNLGNMFLTSNPPNIEDAINLFTQVYNKDNNNIEANNQLGNAYLAKQDYENAINYYQNALRIDSKNNDIRANLAKAYAQQGNYDFAKSTYVELLKSDKNNLDAYIELAKVCMQIDDNASAEKYLIVVQEKNPNYRKAEVADLLKNVTE